MARGIYVSAMTPGSGKSLVTLGLADMLLRHADRVGFFRPIVEGSEPAQDPMVRLMQRKFNLTPETSRGGLTRSELRSLLVAGERGEVDSRCLTIYNEVAAHCDVVIIEGTDLSGHDVALEFVLNARLANNLGAVVLAVVNAREMTVPETADAVDVSRRELHAERCDLLAMMVNRALPETVDEIRAAVRPGASGRPVYVMPELNEISQPSMSEVAKALNARQVAGSPSLERDVVGIKVAAMTVGNFIAQLEHGNLVIAPSDRADVMVAGLASAVAPEFPVPSGMLLTGGLPIDPGILALLSQAPFPVFAVDVDTYSAARQVSRVRGEISSGQRRKVAAALGVWTKNVDEEELLERLELPRPEKITPLRFLNQLIVKARVQRKHIVLPEGLDTRVLRAAEILHRRDVCSLTLLGPEGEVRELAASEGIDLSGTAIINPATSALRDDFAREYAQLRAKKGITLPEAQERMLHGAYFGTMMVHLGRVDGMVSGAAHTTANTIRPALEFIRTKEGVDIVSSVFLMLLEDRVLVYGDCAVNPNPDAKQLADIALASADTAAQFGVPPRVAMLSYSTGASGHGESVEMVREATKIVRSRRPDLPVEGPIQYDAAVDASTAASKMPGSDVAGHATVFIFPDLNTGNNTYKAVQQSAGAVAVGPVLQGLRKPVNDLSRGCTVEDIVNTVAITAVQAQEG